MLEIGFGHGVAASLVCERLGDGGHYAGVDRSQKMAGMAARRNRAHVESGRARFEASDFERADLGDRRFDKAFAFNVALLYRPPAPALTGVRALLDRGGVLYVFAQMMGDAFVVEQAALMREHGYDVRRTLTAATEPYPSVCVVGAA